MGLVKRFDRSMDPKIDMELDRIIQQLPHKDDVENPVIHINKPISADDKNLFTEGKLTFNSFDGKLYLRAGDNLFSLTATQL